MGSNAVDGENSYPDGTLFLNDLEVGKEIRCDAYPTEWYIVRSIIDQNHLTIYPNFGHTTQTGAATRREGINAQYGFRAQDTLGYYNISNLGSRDTQCRLNSKRMYDCALNRDSSVREPMDAGLVFNYGNLTDLRGVYVEYYDPTKDENITFRVIEQEHILLKKSIRTIIRGFRV
jgi:hypothetical protein